MKFASYFTSLSPQRLPLGALAYPDRQVVLVDSLWGLPDGLQYLNHDTFEFDLKRGETSSGANSI